MTQFSMHLYLGGARSGKSAAAEHCAMTLAAPSGRLPFYLATGQAFDDEMQARIDLHQQRRGSDWNLVEAPIDLGNKIALHDTPQAVMLVDCLSVWVTNLLIGNHDFSPSHLAQAHINNERRLMFTWRRKGNRISSK